MFKEQPAGVPSERLSRHDTEVLAPVAGRRFSDDHTVITRSLRAIGVSHPTVPVETAARQAQQALHAQAAFGTGEVPMSVPVAMPATVEAPPAGAANLPEHYFAVGELEHAAYQTQPGDRADAGLAQQAWNRFGTNQPQAGTASGYADAAMPTEYHTPEQQQDAYLDGLQQVVEQPAPASIEANSDFMVRRQAQLASEIDGNAPYVSDDRDDSAGRAARIAAANAAVHGYWQETAHVPYSAGAGEQDIAA